MSHFHQAVKALIERVKQAEDGVTRIEEVLDLSPEFSAIDWLDAQPIYPKFYWQSRDTREEVVALGQLFTFSDPAPAYTVLNEGQRVWGGKAFDGESDKSRRCMPSFFFLPQIELIRSERQWSLAVNLNTDISRTLSNLRKLSLDVRPLAPISTHITAMTHTPALPQWEKKVEQALCGIDQNQFKKVVLARKTELDLSSEVKPTQLLKASYQQNHHSFHFMLALDSKHGFIGSTPERLYYRHERELHTEALAGTIGRGNNATHDMELANWLSRDSKNLNENQYVVDDIIERLEPHSQSIEVEDEARLVRLRKVQHLKRTIQVKLNEGINGIQLLGALQPTAAVAGLPRKEA